ncbi:kinase-like domain-containing protein [Sporodiniella umbellata]|nr:kinase-like domain-containing protein [Sporodiniella umbellata]
MTILAVNKRIRSSEKILQKSRSEPNCQANNHFSVLAYAKRKSTGSLRHTSLSRSPSSCSTTASTTSSKIWRPPGHCEIPDILGHAYLKPSPPVALDLRPTDISKQVSKRPWYPPSPRCQIPDLPPLKRQTAKSTAQSNRLEVRLKKLLPKIPVSATDPTVRYGQFKEVGTGVNGAVVRAVCRKQGTRVAIKRCRLDPDREYRAAILRELRIMASGHQNLIGLREVSLWKEDVLMTMDLMRCSVFAVLCQRGIPEEYTVYMTCETLKGLSYLHRQGILHRDVKCENLLLGWHGEVKLADFGLSAKTSRVNHERLGTTKWMAPEVIREEEYNEKIDMWSLGITIIEMMDRVPPHYAIKDEEELFDVIATEPSPTFTYSYPTMYMRGLVAWLLDEEPQTRPSAADALMEIEAHVDSRLLPCSSSQDLVRFMNHVLPADL